MWKGKESKEECVFADAFNQAIYNIRTVPFVGV